MLKKYLFLLIFVFSFIVFAEPAHAATCSITSFSGSPSSIWSGEYSDISWTTTDCHHVTLRGIDRPANSGSNTLHFGPFTANTTYTLTAVGDGANNTDTATLTITIKPNPSSCTIKSFYPRDNHTNGSETFLRWNTVNCTNVTLSQNIGSSIGTTTLNSSAISPMGKSIKPNADTIYTLTADGGGTTVTKTVTVTVTPLSSNDCRITEFYPMLNTGAETHWAYAGAGSVILHWRLAGNCITENIPYTDLLNWSVANQGYLIDHQYAYPFTNPADYKLTVSGPNNSDSQSTSLEVTHTGSNTGDNSLCNIFLIQNGIQSPNTTILAGDSTNLKWQSLLCMNLSIYPSPLNFTGHTPPNTNSVPSGPLLTDTIFTLSGDDGINTPKTKSVTVPVTKACKIDSFTIDNDKIYANDHDRILSWKTTDCSSVGIDSVTQTTTTGTKSISPTATKTYKLVAGGIKNPATNIATATVTATLTVAPCTDTIAADNSTEMLTKESGTTSRYVLTNTSWTATSDAPWLTIQNPLGFVTFNANYTANTGASPRTANVTITAGCKTEIYKVTQSGTENFLNTNIESIVLPHTPINPNNEIKVTTNKGWKATIPNEISWLSFDQNTDLKNITNISGVNVGLNLYYSQNTASTARGPVTITITSNDNSITKYVSVTQCGQVSCSFCTDSVILSPENSTVTNVPGSFSSNVVANTSWTATSNDPTWLHVTTGFTTFTVNYDENTTMTPRIGTIKITTSCGEPVVFTLTQLGIPIVLEVNPNSLVYPASGGSNTLTVNSNVSWTATTDTPWLTIDKNSGIIGSTGMSAVAVNNNGSTVARNATIKFTSSIGAKETVVTISQDGRGACSTPGCSNSCSGENCPDPLCPTGNSCPTVCIGSTCPSHIRLSQDLTLPWSDSSASLTLETNVDWQLAVTYPSGTLPWLNLQGFSPSGLGVNNLVTIPFIFGQNVDVTPRSATVIVSGTNNPSVSDTATITQNYDSSKYCTGSNCANNSSGGGAKRIFANPTSVCISANNFQVPDIDIDSNVNWVATSDKSWLKVNNKDSSPITTTAEVNLGPTRSAFIKILGNGVQRLVPVTQMADGSNCAAKPTYIPF